MKFLLDSYLHLRIRTSVVQQTARGVGETASAAATLSVQSEELQRLVRRFKTG